MSATYERVSAEGRSGVPIHRRARVAGLLYVGMLVVGLPGLLFIPARLLVRGDAVATAEHIRAATTLFRLGIASELAYLVVFVFLGLALYRLFETVSRSLAMQMAALVLVSVPIVFVDVVNELAALVLLGRPTFLSSFTPAQLDSLAYLFLRLHAEGIGIVQIFWGLWLVPFGILVIRSESLPRILGVLLLVGAVGELLRAATSLFPSLGVIDPLANLLALGELPIIFWLLVRGFMPVSEATHTSS